MIVELTNRDKEFYEYMGPYFGSRKVERITGDRMYDDDRKTWLLVLDNEKRVKAFLSISDMVIKNIYGDSETALEELLSIVHDKTKKSIVSAMYRDCYIKSGYIIKETKNRFLVIEGGVHADVDHTV